MCICEQSLDQIVDAPICDSCLPEFLEQVQKKYNCNIMLLNDSSGCPEYRNVYVKVEPQLDQLIKKLTTTLYVYIDEHKVSRRLEVWGDELLDLQWLELFYALSDVEEFTYEKLSGFRGSASGLFNSTSERYWLSGDVTTMGYNVKKLFEKLELFQQLKELLLFFKELQEEKGMTLI